MLCIPLAACGVVDPAVELGDLTYRIVNSHMMALAFPMDVQQIGLGKHEC